MEVTVGAFMFMVMLALGVFTIILSRQSLFTPTYYTDIAFDEIMGLREGDNVYVRGVTIGKIKRITASREGVTVRCALDRKLELHEDYRVEILASSVLGGRFLNIYEGSPGAPARPPGAPIRGATPMDLVDQATRTVRMIRTALDEGGLLENARSMVERLNKVAGGIERGEGTVGKLVTDESAYNDIKAAAANLKSVTDRIARGEGTLGKLVADNGGVYDDLRSTMSNVTVVTRNAAEGKGTIGKLLSDDDTVYGDLKSTMSNVSIVARNAAEGKGTLGKLLSADDSVYKDLQASAKSIREITETVNRGEGTLGKLAKDPEIYDDAKLLIDEARATIDDFRETAPITTFSSIFFGAF